MSQPHLSAAAAPILAAAPAQAGELGDFFGFERLRVEGDFDGRPFGPESPRQIVWARARPA